MTIRSHALAVQAAIAADGRYMIPDAAMIENIVELSDGIRAVEKAAADAAAAKAAADAAAAKAAADAALAKAQADAAAAPADA